MRAVGRLASVGFAALVVATLQGGCGGGSESDASVTPAGGCRPRVTIFCRCPNGDGGWQTCSEDGKAFGLCGPCDAPSTGGSGGGSTKTKGCGNGIVEDDEQCDDGNADDADACTTGCRKARCGDALVHAGVEECDDGNQNDDDACSNTCRLPTSGTSSCPGAPVSPLPDAALSRKGDLKLAKSGATGTCGGAGREAIFTFAAPVAGNTLVGASTSSASTDLLVYVREGDCAAGKELACSNNAKGGGSEVATFHATKGTKYFVFVDTVLDDTGPYELLVQITPDTKCEGEGAGCDTGQPGICATGKLVCQSGKLACQGTFAKAPKEQCGDGLDNDCNGKIDDGCACGHDLCAAGLPLGDGCDPCVAKVCAKDDYCCTGGWDTLCIAAVATECASAKCAPGCAHSPCTTGDKLVASCDKPSTCVATICQTDPFCCGTGWDAECVKKVKDVCMLACQ